MQANEWPTRPEQQPREQQRGSDGGNPLAADAVAAETARGFDSKANLPRRLERLGKAKDRALSMWDFITKDQGRLADHRKQALELGECGSYLVFRQYVEADVVRLHGMRSCRQHILCPLCAIRRGSKLIKRYLELVDWTLVLFPALEFHMVTFTVRDGADLLERFTHLAACLCRGHHRRHIGRQLARNSEFEKIRGAVWSFEFKRGAGSGMWHPHVHCVWACDPGRAPDAALLAREWQDITGDSFIIETHPLYGEMAEGFAEVFKYAVKFADLPLVDNLEAYDVLHGRRLVGSSGVLFGVGIPEGLEDDAYEGGEYFDLMFRHYRGEGYVHMGYVEQREAA